jgi:hypothetical protein
MQGPPAWTVSEAFAPEPGESLNGFVARAAAAEGLPNALELTSLAGAVWPHRPELSRGSADFSILGACLGTEVDRLEAMSYPIDPQHPDRRLFRGISVDRRFLVHNERRFSPTTLARRGVHLAEWQLRPFPFCRDSWELLAARCPDPDCSATQRWYHASGIDLCDRCGEPLVNAVHGTVPEGDRTALGAALGLFDTDPACRADSVSLLPVALRDVEPGDLLDLLVAVAGVHEPGIRCPSDRLVFRVTAEPGVLSAAVADAWRTLTKWPEGFHDLASDRIATRAGRFGDGNRGATMRLLEAADDVMASPVLARLVTDLRHSIRSNASERGIGCRAAGGLPYVRATALVALRRQRVLSTVFAIDGDEPQPYLDRLEVQALSDALRSSVPMNNAAHLLGIPDHGVEQLETLGLLAFERLVGTIAADGAHRVTAASLDGLTTALTRVDDRPPPDWVTLSSVMRSIGGRAKPWGPVIATLLHGAVNYAILEGSQPVLRRVVVDPTQALVLAASIYVAPPQATFLSLMSKGDALELLNLHNRHGSAILQRWPSDQSNARTVPVSDILALARRHVSIGELVARTGQPARALAAMLATSGVPIDGPWADRRDAEAALFGDRRSKSPL